MTALVVVLAALAFVGLGSYVIVGMELDRLLIEWVRLVAEFDRVSRALDTVRADNRRQAALIAALQSTPDALVLPFLPEQRRPGGAS